MKRSILTSVAVLGFTTTAWAQTAATLTAAPENSGGTPGSWVQAAITRHKALIAVRVNAPRGGEAAGDRSSLAANTTTGTSTSLNTGSTTLDSLLSLLGGSSSSLTALTGLLGTTSTSTGSTTTTGSTATDPRLAALLALRDANKNSSTEKTSTATQQSSSTAASSSSSTTRVGGAAVNRLPKAEQRLQSSTTDTTTETPFAARWASAMLSTFFTAVTAGFQSTGFITFLKDGLRPLMYPTDSSGDGSNSGNNNNSGGSGSGGSGSGIEDISPGGNGSGGGGSTL